MFSSVWRWDVIHKLFVQSIQTDIMYRTRVLIWMLQSVFYIISFSALWLAVAQSGGDLQGYTSSDIMTYFVGMLAVEYIVDSWVNEEMNSRIHDGSLTPLLLQPFPFVAHLFLSQIGFRVTRILMYGIVFFLLPLFLPIPLRFPTHVSTYFLLPFVFCICHLIAFNIKIILGAITFWWEETGEIGALYWIVTAIPTGWVAPLEFLPNTVQKISTFLPFQYTIAFPLQVILERQSFLKILLQLVIALLWLLVIVMIRRWIVTRGLRHYSAVGQ